MKNENNFIPALLIILIGIGIYLVVNQNNNAKKEVDQNATQQLALSQKCAKDGEDFFVKFQQENNSQGDSWDDPQFHYDKTLNTCLVYTRYINFYEGDTADSDNMDEVRDIYSNKVLI